MKSSRQSRCPLNRMRPAAAHHRTHRGAALYGVDPEKPQCKSPIAFVANDAKHSKSSERAMLKNAGSW
jgi:hypothetical protein